jgi:UDP-N-acetylmuramate dehydrogenase
MITPPISASDAANIAIQTDVLLAKRNTFGINAIATHYVQIDSLAQLQALRNDAALSALPRLILGGGSNLVLSDVVEALVLQIELSGKSLIAEDADFYYVQAQAGEGWHAFVQWTLVCGYAGLENLSLIPGTVGAAPIQNIGAYGLEVQDYFHTLTYFDFETGQTHTLDKAACKFAYRDSVFKHELKDRAVILDVTFALPKAWTPRLGYADVNKYLADKQITTITPTEISNAIIAIRQSKLPDPAVIGNAGSFFKNPIVPTTLRDQIALTYPNVVSYPQTDTACKLAAGWLIEQAGWKGRSLGNAGVYEKQALVLVNRGGASGLEVRELAQAIQHDVQAKFGVTLEIEPVFVG